MNENELKNTFYTYKIEDKVKQKTSDGISMADLITQGLNNSNNATSGKNKSQWLSSRCVFINPRLCNFLCENCKRWLDKWHFFMDFE